MKIFLRKAIADAKEDDPQFTETEKASLSAANLSKSAGDKIHICYHDENPVKPCRLV